MFPARPPKSRTRYDRPMDGPYCVRSPAGRPGTASDRDRVAVASRDSVGNQLPRLAPYTSAAARACAQDRRVTGLFRSARSMTASRDASEVEMRVVVPRSRSAALVTLGGGVQYTLGCAGAPGPPSMCGG